VNATWNTDLITLVESNYTGKYVLALAYILPTIAVLMLM
jgi:hypothetical protein